MYVRGEDLAKWTEGSLEARVEAVAAMLEAQIGAAVEVIATREDGALFRTADGQLHEAAFPAGTQVPADCTVRPAAIPQYAGDRVPPLVAEELRDVTAGMLRGAAPDRARLVALARAVQPGEDYWLSGVLRKVEEALAAEAPEHWHTAYQVNQEKIRSALYGQIRELEGRVPKTAYAKLPAGRLAEFEGELRESLGILGTLCGGVVDGCSDLVFDGDDEFYGAIRDSLIAEARLLQGLLAKAERLMRAEDMGSVAVAHDRLCGRAKVLEIVAAYLTERPTKRAEEGK